MIQCIAVLAIVTGFVQLEPGSLRPAAADSALERYLGFIAALRDAQTLDFDAEVANVRNKDGARTKTNTRFEASLARGDRGWIRRTAIENDVEAGNGNDAGVADDSRDGRVLLEVLADGELAYQVDRTAGAFIRLWPPRFLAGSESRGMIVLREFLEESIESPLVVRAARHAKFPDLDGVEVVYSSHAEAIYFDADGSPRIAVRIDGNGSIRTTYTFREFELGRAEAAAEYACIPPSDFEDVTIALARSTPLSFEPVAPSAGAVGKAPPALLLGARDVDAAFLDHSRALVRLRAMRGRPVVVVFLDRDAPQHAETLRRLKKLAGDVARDGVRAQFVAVYDRDPPPSDDRDPPNLRFAKPLRNETTAAFGVFYYPTTFVIDRNGDVVLRSAVMFDEAALRASLGF